MFVCPKCKSHLIKENNSFVICDNGHKFDIIDDIFNFLPVKMNEITLGDGKYHDIVKKQWINKQQLNTFRNIYHHNYIIEFISNKSNKDCLIVELGGGVGFDLKLFLKKSPLFNKYVFSEIDHGMTRYTKSKIQDSENIIFANIDASQLPFKRCSVNIIYFIATLHHFQEFDATLAEISNVIKHGGYLVCGIEPNRNFVALLELLKHPYKLFLKKKDISPADEVTKGFSTYDFEKIAKKHNFIIYKLKGVWFISGFIHYGLEFLYRIFKLKKRIILPAKIEKPIVHFDNAILNVPLLLRQLSWHYTIIFKKNDCY